QAREAVTGCDSETAEGFLARAREAFEAAEQRYRDGRPEIALSGLKQAREMAQKAIRECRQTDQLEQRYRRLTAQVEQLSERIQSAPEASREETRRLLGQAREQLARARGLIDRQENEQALAALQAAYLAMERARLYLTVRQ
ncbi:MAG: hypothetical protein KKA42_12855, partial [candidate division Zixibacteria bacterium]|nr:hypothetical protein [candidate division Zixibacteria bacterium]